MRPVPADVRTLERELTTALGVWAVGSVLKGAAIAGFGRRSGRDGVAAFGRQQVGWGAIDGLIAGVGAWKGRREPLLAPAEELERARRLHRLLRINTAADVGYVAGGLLMTLAAPALSRRTGRSAATIRGAGVGIVVQGGFLLALDALFAARVGRSVDAIDDIIAAEAVATTPTS